MKNDSIKDMCRQYRSEAQMLRLILQTAETLQVEAVAMSGSRTDTKAPKDEFQDYDVVYVVDDLDNLTSDLSWLDQFGNRLIEQYNVLGNRRLYLMLFEDGNRIDLTLCPKNHIQEWVDSEADYTVLKDEKGLFDSYTTSPERYWTSPASQTDFEKACNEFWWVSAYVVKGIHRNHLVYATDHLYGICQQELLKLLAWQVARTTSIFSSIYLQRKRKNSQICLIFQVKRKSLSLCLLRCNFSTKKLKSLLKRWALITIRKWLRR